MFCPQCGREYAGRANFCCQCGTATFTPPPQRKPLRLSRTDEKIAGVCGGFANYLGLDATLVRILWVMLAIFGGLGVLAYFVAWIIMPQEPLVQASRAPASTASPPASTNP